MELGEAIIKKLKLSGVETIFGIPGGGTSSDLLCNMEEYKMNFILTQSETSAAIMASVVGEVKGVPGVCIGDLGPGALSFGTGVAYSYLDRSPLILLTDKYPDENNDYVLRQKISHRDSFKPITKLTSALSISNWSSQMDNAFKITTSPKYGPVHFDIPNDIVKKGVKEEVIGSSIHKLNSAYDLSEIEKAIKKIEEANNPIIIIGLEINHGSGKQFNHLKNFIEKTNIPVFKTAKAKGSISDYHEKSFGLFMGGKFEEPILEKSDLLITIGLDPVELLPKKWNYNGFTISIGNAANNNEMYRSDIELHGNIEYLLKEFNDRIFDTQSVWKKEDISNYNNYVKEKLSIESGGLSAYRVIEIAQEILPQDTIMTTDVGASKLLVTQFWKARNPRSFYISNGLATMGFALPAAMALQHLHPTKVVASLTGDGGFMMKLSDISTAVQNEWPVVSIVFSDQKLSLMDVKQRSKGYEDNFGNNFLAPDYVKFAESFGANGWSADNEEDLKKAITEALNSKNKMPSIIEARINPEAYHKQFAAIREL